MPITFRDQPVFSTKQVANLFEISQQAVIRCFDNGILKGFRVPGSRFRRSQWTDVYHFAVENSLPRERLYDVNSGKRTVVVGAASEEFVASITQATAKISTEVLGTTALFDLGTLVGRYHIDALLVDTKMQGVDSAEKLLHICRLVRDTTRRTTPSLLVLAEPKYQVSEGDLRENSDVLRFDPVEPDTIAKEIAKWL